MNVFVNLKSFGKQKKGLEKIPYTLPDNITALRGLIDAVTRQEADAYNSHGTDNMLVDFLTEVQIEDNAATGKVDFGRLYSENKADAEKASAVAIQGFEDGLFRVFVNKTEATELDTPLTIQDGDTLTFIRLTFLAGRLW